MGCYSDHAMQAHEHVLPAPRGLTRAEYYRMGELGFFRGERVELIHGIVIRMPPIGPRHSARVVRLDELLLPRLLGRASVRVQQPFVAWDESEPEPDVAVVPVASYVDRHPDHAFLLIEVAETSLDYDRDTKGPLYAASGVPEYWIVDVVGRAVEVYAEPGTRGYARSRRVIVGETLTVGAFPDVVVSVAELFGE